MTKNTAWRRHLHRLEEEEDTGGFDRFDRFIRQRGKHTALARFFVMVLEHIPLRAGENEESWNARASNVEKFWVSTLRTAYNIRGWNVEHAPKTLKVNWRGIPCRRERGDIGLRSNGTPTRKRRRTLRLEVDDEQQGRMEDKPKATRRGRHRKTAQASKKQRTERGRQYRTRDIESSGRRLILALKKGRLREYLQALAEHTLRERLNWLLRLDEARENSGLTRHEWCYLRDTLWKQWWTVRCSMNSPRDKTPKALVIISFAAPAIEKLHLASMLASPDIMALAPRTLWQEIGKPTLAYTYAEAPFWTIANFTQMGRSTSRQVRCRCREPWCSQWIHPSVGHIMTKAPELAGHFHPKIQELVEKGTKYRADCGGMYATPQEWGEDTASNRILYMMSNACDRLIERAEEQFEIDKRDLQEWKQGVLKQTAARALQLTTADSLDLMERTAGTDQGENNILKEAWRELRLLQESFVMGEADKESGVYTFVCAQYYREQVHMELQSDTYELRGDGATRAREISASFNKSVLGGGAQMMEYHPCRNEETCRSLYVHRLREDFAFCKKWGMVISQKMNGKKLSRTVRETEEEFFVRTHQLAQQYGTLKTHKETPKLRFIAGGSRNSLVGPNIWLNRILWELKPHVDKMFAEVSAEMENKWMCDRYAKTPFDKCWIVKESKEAAARISGLNGDKRKRRALLAKKVRPLTWLDRWANRTQTKATQLEETTEFSVWDFTTLYPKLSHEVIREMKALLQMIFEKQRTTEGGEVLLRVHRYKGYGNTNRWVKADNRGQTRRNTGRLKYFTLTDIEEILDYLLDNAYVTFGDKVYRQRLGVPIGFGASPMIANFALCLRELQGVRRIVERVDSPTEPGTESLPRVEGHPLEKDGRRWLASLASRLVRCCRNIDDVLFIDMSKAEVEWAIQELYEPTKTGLELNCESASWKDGGVHYLDMEVKKDRMGWFTDLYDKRTALAAMGRMGEVRRFPHIQSALTDNCKYNVLTSFLHRINRVVMRRGRFVKHCTDRVLNMTSHGYGLKRLMHTVTKYMKYAYVPAEKSGEVLRRIRTGVTRLEQKRAREAGAEEDRQQVTRTAEWTRRLFLDLEKQRTQERTRQEREHMLQRTAQEWREVLAVRGRDVRRQDRGT